MPEPAYSARPHAREGAEPAAGDTAPAAVPPCMATMDVVPDGDRMSVTLWGELDLGSRRLLPDLHDLLTLSGGGIDLRLDAVGFCDCSGLNVLLDLRTRALDQGKTVTIRSSGLTVERLLDLTGTRELFTAPDGREDAARPATSGSDPETARPAAPGSAPEAVRPATSRSAPETAHPATPGSAPEAVRPAAAPDSDSGADAGQDLRTEVAQLRRAMQTRPTIDLARGILMASFGLSPEGAWSVLVRTSQNTNTKLHHLARDLVGTVHGSTLPEQVRQQLAAAVAGASAGSDPAAMCHASGAAADGD